MSQDVTPPPIVAPPVVTAAAGAGQSAPREVRLDEAGQIDEDLPCRGCGYNLRGLDPRGTCPECSVPIGRSIHGDLLRFSDPDWLGRLARGLKLVIIGILSEVALGLILVVAVGFMAASGPMPMGRIMTTAGVMGAAISMITVIGVWLLTAQDPGQMESEPPVSPRRVARWCILAQVAAAPLQITTQSGAGFAAPAALTSLDVLLMLLLMAVQVIVLIGHGAGLLYLRGLALRLPRDSLARQTKVVTWGYVCSQGVGVIGGTAFLLLFSTIPAPGGTPGAAAAVMVLGGAAGCVAAAGALVFGIWALVLLFTYAGALRSAAASAITTWAVAAPGPGAASAGA